MAYVVSISSPW